MITHQTNEVKKRRRCENPSMGKLVKARETLCSCDTRMVLQKTRRKGAPFNIGKSPRERGNRIRKADPISCAQQPILLALDNKSYPKLVEAKDEGGWMKAEGEGFQA